MAKPTSECLENLIQGKSFTWKLRAGGDLASMRGIFKYGQEITLSPVGDFHEVRAGDIALLKWHGGSYILHPVQEVDGDQFLIVNSLGKINGWTHGSAILGKVTRLVDPPARPAVPEMLVILQAAYQQLASRCAATVEELLMLEGIVQDLRWYMERITPARWEKLPSQNKWSFASNLWYLTRKTREAADTGDARPIAYLLTRANGW